MTNAGENISLILYEFKLQQIDVIDNMISKSEYGSYVTKFLEDTFDCSFSTITAISNSKLTTQIMEANKGDILLTMRLYDRAAIDREFLLTITLEVMSSFDMVQKNLDLQQFSEKERKRLSMIKDATSNEKLAPDQELVGYLPIIQRGNDYSPYYKTSDDRFCQYNIKEVLYDVRSQYQHIIICDTIDSGRLLVLDGLANLAENDTICYTHALLDMTKEKENYAGSNVLVLGGGDGGVLKELLELSHPPEYVTMIELDNEVMTGCAKYMRSVCGKYLDEGNRKGSNYEVICGDALKYMENAIASNKYFDYIIGDLTDAPVDTSDNESSRETWVLLEQVLNLVKQLIKPNTGRYLTHFNGKSVPKLIEEYEHVLNKLTHHSSISLKSSFSRSESFVPSFQEVWIFYQLCMTETR